MSSESVRDDSVRITLAGKRGGAIRARTVRLSVYSPDGVVVRVNETLASWLGYAQNELTGRVRFLDLLTPGGKIFYETHLAPLLRMHGEVNEIALDLSCKDGRIIPSLVSATQEAECRRNANCQPHHGL